MQAELAETTDPAMRQVLENEITTQQNILADLAEEASGLGIDAAELAALSALAVTMPADDPIALQAFVPESWIDDFFCGFVSGVHDSFMDGRSWDSLQGATMQMLDVMLLNLTDISTEPAHFTVMLRRIKPEP